MDMMMAMGTIMKMEDNVDNNDDGPWGRFDGEPCQWRSR